MNKRCNKISSMPYKDKTLVLYLSPLKVLCSSDLCLNEVVAVDGRRNCNLGVRSHEDYHTI